MARELRKATVMVDHHHNNQRKMVSSLLILCISCIALPVIHPKLGSSPFGSSPWSGIWNDTFSQSVMKNNWKVAALRDP